MVIKIQIFRLREIGLNRMLIVRGTFEGQKYKYLKYIKKVGLGVLIFLGEKYYK